MCRLVGKHPLSPALLMRVHTGGTHPLSPALLMHVHAGRHTPILTCSPNACDAGQSPCTFFISWYPEFFVCWLVVFLLLVFWFCLYFFYQRTSLQTQVWKSKGVTSSQLSGTLEVVSNMASNTLVEAFPWSAPMFISLFFCSKLIGILFCFDLI